MKINNKTVNFNKSVSSLDFKEFESMCLNMMVFKELPLLRRTEEIKKAYGYIKRDVQAIKDTEPIQDLQSGNERRRGGAFKTEQRAANERKDCDEQKGESKIQKQKIRSEEKETKP